MSEIHYPTKGLRSLGNQVEAATSKMKKPVAERVKSLFRRLIQLWNLAEGNLRRKLAEAEKALAQFLRRSDQALLDQAGRALGEVTRKVGAVSA